MPNLVEVKFHDQNLFATIAGDVPYVAMKPICENMGLQWEAQLKRIKRHPVLNAAMSIMDMPTNSGVQQMIMLPLEYLNGWLFGIDSSRVNESIRSKVIQYQSECFKVLANHFMPKQPQLPPTRQALTPAQQRHVQERVSQLAKEQNCTHSSLYGQVKSKFRVGTYKEILQSQYPALCQFLLCQPLPEIFPTDTIIFTPQELQYHDELIAEATAKRVQGELLGKQLTIHDKTVILPSGKALSLDEMYMLHNETNLSEMAYIKKSSLMQIKNLVNGLLSRE